MVPITSDIMEAELGAFILRMRGVRSTLLTCQHRNRLEIMNTNVCDNEHIFESLVLIMLITAL